MKKSSKAVASPTERDTQAPNTNPVVPGHIPDAPNLFQLGGRRDLVIFGCGRGKPISAHLLTPPSASPYQNMSVNFCCQTVIGHEGMRVRVLKEKAKIESIQYAMMPSFEASSVYIQDFALMRNSTSHEKFA